MAIIIKITWYHYFDDLAFIHSFKILSGFLTLTVTHFICYYLTGEPQNRIVEVEDCIHIIIMLNSWSPAFRHVFYHRSTGLVLMRQKLPPMSNMRMNRSCKQYRICKVLLRTLDPYKKRLSSTMLTTRRARCGWWRSRCPRYVPTVFVQNHIVVK